VTVSSDTEAQVRRGSGTHQHGVSIRLVPHSLHQSVAFQEGDQLPPRRSRHGSVSGGPDHSRAGGQAGRILFGRATNYYCRTGSGSGLALAYGSLGNLAAR
jgi:hypothetical protein